MEVNIKFIAERAGVSPATVSRVLNGSKSVSAELTGRVMNEVEKYRYHPNVHARGLILKRSNLLAVIAPNVSDIFHAKMISSIETAASERGYSVIVSNIYSDFDKQKRSIRLLQDRAVDGLILLHENTPEELDELEKLIEIPMVLASVNVPGSERMCAGIDDEKAAYDAVSYLYRIGHRRIAGVFCHSYSLGGLRKNGYMRALRSNGIEPNPGLIVESRFSLGFGKEAIEALMRLPEPPTAVFCVADELAIDMIDLLLDQGYSVPSDVSVFGFDDINLASAIRPKLSTIRQPIEQIGREASRMLIAAIEGRKDSRAKLVLPHQLVIRDSCCPPKSAPIPAAAGNTHR